MLVSKFSVVLLFSLVLTTFAARNSTGKALLRAKRQVRKFSVLETIPFLTHIFLFRKYRFSSATSAISSVRARALAATVRILARLEPSSDPG